MQAVDRFLLLQSIERTSCDREAEARGWEEGVSAGSENVREKKSRRKWGTERSLRPHNVCFLSVSSVWPILG